MITQILLNWFAGLLRFVLGSIPSLPADFMAQLSGLPGQIQTLLNLVSASSVLLPWEAMGVGVGIYCYAFLFGAIAGVVIKIINVVRGSGM